MQKPYIIALDQGTTSTRALLFDQNLQLKQVTQQEFPQHFPHSGWVEHNAEDILNSSLTQCRNLIQSAKIEASQIAAIGITNQRETTLIWDRHTGKAIYPAIVWQDRRTASLCASLKQQGYEKEVTARTGLLLDPYFSATKCAWILDHVEGAREKARQGHYLFGTVDSFLIWHLTAGKVHATDATNASRTMLYNIHQGKWDTELLKLFNIPYQILPQVKDSADDFGVTDKSLFGAEIPISGVAGDQQAATIGQACFEVGMMKSTYGTGCFALLNTGDQAIASSNRLLTTIAYQLKGKPTYALEGSIFIAGAVVQWLRDELRLISHASEADGLASLADMSQELYLIPAFTGLGAPYWDAECRGAIFGLNRNSGTKELVKAALESVAFQTRDLLEAMHQDWPKQANKQQSILRVDGGMSKSNWTMQAVSDYLGVAVDRPLVTETTALGAAYLAGLQQGLYAEPVEFAKSWAAETRFMPKMATDFRDKRYAGWKKHIKLLLSPSH